MNTVIKTICAVILTNILLPNVSFAEGDALAGADTFKKNVLFAIPLKKMEKRKLALISLEFIIQKRVKPTDIIIPKV